MYRVLFAGGPGWSILSGVCITIFLTALIVAPAVSFTHWVGSYFLSLPMLAGCLYFGYTFFKEGLKNVPNRHVAIFELLERRMPEPIIEEGYCWHIPYIMTLDVWDAVEKMVEIETVEVLTAEDVAISVDSFFTVYVMNPYLRGNVDKPEEALQQLVDRTVRTFCNGKEAYSIVRSKMKMSQAIQYGYNFEEDRPLTQKEARETFETLERIHCENGHGDELTDLEDIEERMRDCDLPIILGVDTIAEQWGLNIPRLFVRNIRLPKEVEEAAAQILVEDKQREAEKKNMETWAELVRKIKEELPELSHSEVASTAKVVQKLATEEIHTIHGLDKNLISAAAAGVVAMNERKEKGDGRKDQK